eukprot:11911356-Alexandrium_andersonii.AAC.1
MRWTRTSSPSIRMRRSSRTRPRTRPTWATTTATSGSLTAPRRLQQRQWASEPQPSPPGLSASSAR